TRSWPSIMSRSYTSTTTACSTKRSKGTRAPRAGPSRWKRPARTASARCSPSIRCAGTNALHGDRAFPPAPRAGAHVGGGGRSDRRAVKKAGSEVLAVAGRDVVISNAAKLLFPAAKVTKLDVARYYIAVAEGALRGAGGRPNMLVRYPDGIDGEF